MLVGELSLRAGVGAHQLRYYESQGLLEPVRAANGYRKYADDAVLVGQIKQPAVPPYFLGDHYAARPGDLRV